jgi:hypothetical protein
MLEELASRAGLHAALAGRSPQQLLPLLQHLSRHVTDPRHSHVLAGVTARVLDLYATSVHSDSEVRVWGGQVADRGEGVEFRCLFVGLLCATSVHSDPEVRVLGRWLMVWLIIVLVGNATVVVAYCE